MKLLTAYRILIWLLVACVFGMGAALKHAQHRADVLKEQVLTLQQDNTNLVHVLQSNVLPAPPQPKQER